MSSKHQINQYIAATTAGQVLRFIKAGDTKSQETSLTARTRKQKLSLKTKARRRWTSLQDISSLADDMHPDV